VREFAQVAFQHAGYDYREMVIPDPTYFRPAEIFDLVADPSKVKEKLGWKNQYRFFELVREMVESDLSNLS
jgi:GDPmannose 4,6-dehydratase